MSTARVSVGMPVYDGDRYLVESLASVQAQTVADLEIVISDNGSGDGTEEICRAAAAADPRIRYFRHPRNRGAAWNHNFVVHASTAPVFTWHSYDDLVDPAFVERCLEALDDPEVVLSFPRARVVDDHGSDLGPYRDDLPWCGATPSARLRDLLGAPVEETLLHMCYPVYGLVRRDVLLRTPVIAAHNASDVSLLVELALHGRWVQVPERLFSNRRHAASSVPGRTPEEIAAWFSPDASGLFPMPQARLFAAFVSAVSRAPLTPGERLRCRAVLLAWLRRDAQWRVIAGELRLRAKRRPGQPMPALPSPGVPGPSSP